MPRFELKAFTITFINIRKIITTYSITSKEKNIKKFGGLLYTNCSKKFENLPGRMQFE
jgi:hypothetical protein